MAGTAEKGTRTCIGCGLQASKASLYRIVRTADEGVLFDRSGRRAGRGAYVCSAKCFDSARRHKLQRALKCAVSDEEAARIAEELDQALEGALA